MTVQDALRILQAAGTVWLEGEKIRAYLPRRKVVSLHAAIHVVQRDRRTALRLLTQQERDAAAAIFVRSAGARLVTLCGAEQLSAKTSSAVVVPKANNDAQFRLALRKLGLEALPVLARTEPLDSFHRPDTGF